MAPVHERVTLRSNTKLTWLGQHDIEVLADHLLEEDAPRHRLVQRLDQRVRGLQDGELVAITGGAIACRKWNFQAGVAAICAESIDPVRRQLVAQDYRFISLGLAQDLTPLSSASNATPRLASWRLRYSLPLMQELGIVRKVCGAELQEEQPKVFIDAIQMTVVDHRGRLPGSTDRFRL